MTLLKSDRITTEHGFGSVSNVPKLPDGFDRIFTSYRVQTDRLLTHVVVGGQGEPLLLHCGWPETWYAWRYLMPELSRHYTVIAVDPRGFGLSGRPDKGYDADSLADDMFALMDVLGHEQVTYMGHDFGVMVGYAMASNQPRRVRRLIVGEGMIPGVMPSPPLIPEARPMSDFLWHFNFNRAYDINERLVEGREALYFGYQFESKCAAPDSMAQYARDFYIEMIRRVPGTLKASFEYYRAIDEIIPQITQKKSTMLELPVMTFAGEYACGDIVEREWREIAHNVHSVIIPGSGHFTAEEQPQRLLEAVLSYLLSCDSRL